MPMQVVESSYDPEADAATICFVRDARSYRTIVVDEARFFDYDAEGRILFVELLDVSKGVKLEGLPEPELVREALERIGAEQGWPATPVR